MCTHCLLCVTNSLDRSYLTHTHSLSSSLSASRSVPTKVNKRDMRSAMKQMDPGGTGTVAAPPRPPRPTGPLAGGPPLAQSCALSCSHVEDRPPRPPPQATFEAFAAWWNGMKEAERRKMRRAVKESFEYVDMDQVRCRDAPHPHRGCRVGAVHRHTTFSGMYGRRTSRIAIHCPIPHLVLQPNKCTTVSAGVPREPRHPDCVCCAPD